jgi:hypothetical protein
VPSEPRYYHTSSNHAWPILYPLLIILEVGVDWLVGGLY